MSIDSGMSAQGKLTLDVAVNDKDAILDFISTLNADTPKTQKFVEQLEAAVGGLGQTSAQAATGIQKLVAEYESFARVRSMDSKAGPVNQQNTLLQQRIQTEIDAEKRRMEQLHINALQENRIFDQRLRQNESLYNSLPRTRYALYDVAQAWGMVSAATLGAVAATTGVGIAYEREFAQVQRTSGVAGAAVGQLREDLIDLSTDVPESFDAITDIAALGGQLGIAADGLDEFTEVTAKLTATTDLSSEAAGTALGRFQALMGVPSSQFENLASSILRVGVNSVATESQIVQISTQISSMGNFAGLTADQVVGLAGALASTGTQPELARGTVTRLFTLMSQAVAGTTDKLDDFARVSQVSAEDFKSAWGTSEFADVFQRFLAGIGSEGDEAVQTLRDLGITSVRDVPALLRLADAGDVVAQSFSDAATGFADGTELNEQYGIIAETTAAKLTTLGNTLKAIMATLADGAALPILGTLLDLVQRLAESFLAFARNPFGKAALTIVGALTALVGVFAAVRAAQALTMASLAAFITAMRGLQGETVLTTRSMLGMASGFLTAGTAANTGAVGVRAFTWAIRGMQVATGIGAILAGISIAMEVFGQNAQRVDAQMDALKGSLTGLYDAMKADGEIFAETGEGFEYTMHSIEDVADAADAAVTPVDTWAAKLEDAATGTTNATDALDAMPEKIEEVTLAIGRNTAALIGNALAGNDSFVATWQKFGPAIEAAGYTLDDFVAALGSEDGGLSFLKAALQDVGIEIANIESQYANFQNLDDDALAAKFSRLKDAREGMRQLLATMEALDNSLLDATTRQQIAEAAMRNFADSLEEGAGAGDNYVTTLQDIVNEHMALVNSAAAVEGAMFNLGASIYENGLDFSTTTEAGRANLSTLSQVINAMAAQAGDDTAALANNVAGLMQALGAMGVNVARDLGFLGEMVAALGGTVGDFNTSVFDAIRGIESGFGSKAPKAINRTRDSVKKAEKEVRTFADYASDLGKVLSDAFDFRFGEQIAKDNTADLWKSWKDDIKDAKNRAKELRLEIRAIKAEQASLQARRSTLVYQLDVARRYGNTLAEEQILAEIGEVDSDLADNKKDLKDATKELKDVQDELNAGLKGNTEEARKQRERIRELVQSYQDQIEEAANNGASQEELRKLSAKLKKEFEDQAKKIGLSEKEVKKYSKTFDDTSKIIKKVPRNVTTKWNANASPAEKALANFRAKMDRERKKIEKPFKLNARFNSKVDSNLTGLKAAQQALAEALKAQAKAYKDQPGGGTRVDYWDKKVNYWRNILANYKGYAEGGFTGRGGKYDTAGTVHRGEFVFPKEYVNQSTGLPYANVLGSMAHAMGAMSAGAGGGGTGIQLVELLPNQLDQLARAVSSRVSIDGRVVAAVSNGYNSAQYNRGAG